MFARWTKNTLLTLLLAGLGQAVSAQTEDTRYYAIPAGPLSSAINQFMLHSGVSISMDANRIRTLVSPGLQGNYGLTEGLQKLLENTGYQATSYQGGYLLTEQTPANQPAANLVLPALEIQGHQESIYDVPGSVSRISREDIDRTGPRHASEILQATPGVFTVTNEQNPSVSVNIRGLKDFGRVNMNIDGMRQNYQRSGHGQRNGEMFFDTEFLSGVEITKGAHAGAGGAGASGGVATFRTIDAEDILQNHEDRFAGRLRLSHGVPDWDNGQNLSGSLALAARPTEKTDVLVAYSRKNTSEYQPGQNGTAMYWGQTNLEAPVNIVNSTGQDMQSWLAKARWMATDSLELKLTALGTNMAYSESQAFNTEQASRELLKESYCNPPLDFVLNDPAQYEYYCEFEYDPESVYPTNNTNETESRSLALDLHYAPGSDWVDLKTKLYSVTTRNTSTTSANTYSMKTQTDTLGALLENTSRFFAGNHTLIFNYGAEIFRDENRPDAESQTLTGNQITLLSGATPHGKRQIIGTWLRTDWNYHALTLTPGIRWEQYNLQGTTGFSDSYNGQTLWQFAEINVDHTENKLLPSLGVALDVIDTPASHLQLFANAGLSWRPPAITETLTASSIPYHIPAITTYPNWTLIPEETQNAELGFNLRLGASPNQQLQIKLAQFYNRTENYIHYGASTIKPGMTTQPFVYAQSMYVNALNDLIFEGQELQLDFIWHSFYGSFSVTHTEKRTDEPFFFQGKKTEHLIYYPYALGGPNGEDPATYCPPYQFDGTCITFGTLYNPPVPEWTGRLTLGNRWLQNKLDTNLTLTCASQTGDYMYADIEDVTGEAIGLRPFCALDGYTSYQFNNHLRLGANLKNITDRKYIQAMGDGMVRSYAPGRTLMAHLQWAF